ncbi:flagellar biosynthetic protein FliR [Meridianimarinicoccus roseus]|nr:flagellar biosynthetic protein FliR [Meridianimarinicoccus roseus]
MTEAAALLLPYLEGGLALAVAVFLRIGAAMALLPAFGAQVVPLRIKLAAAGAFTAIVAPVIAADTPIGPLDLPLLLRLAATETVSGLALGFSVRLFIWVLQVCGTIAAQATSLSQLLGAESVDPQPAISQLLMMAGLGLAAISGLHVRVAEAMVQSYDTLPMGRFPMAGAMTEWAVWRVAEMFSLAFTFAAPFVIGSVLYNLALGVINRAMPQLMVAFVGAPAITAAGLVLLLLSAPVILPMWLSLLHMRLMDPFGGGP